MVEGTEVPKPRPEAKKQPRRNFTPIEGRAWTKKHTSGKEVNSELVNAFERTIGPYREQLNKYGDKEAVSDAVVEEIKARLSTLLNLPPNLDFGLHASEQTGYSALLGKNETLLFTIKSGSTTFFMELNTKKGTLSLGDAALSPDEVNERVSILAQATSAIDEPDMALVYAGQMRDGGMVLFYKSKLKRTREMNASDVGLYIFDGKETRRLRGGKVVQYTDGGSITLDVQEGGNEFHYYQPYPRGTWGPGREGKTPGLSVSNGPNLLKTTLYDNDQARASVGSRLLPK